MVHGDVVNRQDAGSGEGGTQRQTERGVREDNWYRVPAGSGDDRRPRVRRGAHAATRHVDEAKRILTEEVIQPALAARPGVAQLAAVCEAYFGYVERRVFPGGCFCFFAAAALEMGTRPGPVKERVAAISSGFTALLRAFAATALQQHELPAREDPGRLAFELHAICWAPTPNSSCTMTRQPWTWLARSFASG